VTAIHLLIAIALGISLSNRSSDSEQANLHSCAQAPPLCHKPSHLVDFAVAAFFSVTDYNGMLLTLRVCYSDVSRTTSRNSRSGKPTPLAQGRSDIELEASIDSCHKSPKLKEYYILNRSYSLNRHCALSPCAHNVVS
jgi:hypothetical protein